MNMMELDKKWKLHDSLRLENVQTLITLEEKDSKGANKSGASAGDGASPWDWLRLDQAQRTGV